MKTFDFLCEHNACEEGVTWALSISDDMAEVWDALIEKKKYVWLLWTVTRPGVFSDTVLRKLICRFVRETPLADGHKVWDLLIDERSRMAIEVAERYADGKATKEELSIARLAAEEAAAYDDTSVATYEAADAASSACAACIAPLAFYDCATRKAAHASARAAYAASHTAAYVVYVAHVRMVAELGNPFKKGKTE